MSGQVLPLFELLRYVCKIFCGNVFNLIMSGNIL